MRYKYCLWDNGTRCFCDTCKEAAAYYPTTEEAEALEALWE